MKNVLSAFATLLSRVMEARVTRLNLLIQQEERNLNENPCCKIINCCLDDGKFRGSKQEPQYYFHK